MGRTHDGKKETRRSQAEMKSRICMLFIALACAFTADAARLSDEEISQFGGCYFAPITSGGIWRMRTQDGEIREFEADSAVAGRLSGVGGWWATVAKDGTASVYAPETGDYPQMVYNFANGRLASLDVEGRHCRFNYPNPLVYDDEAIVPLWPDAEKTTREEFARETTMWKDDHRLRLWFAGPNQAGAFCSFVFLLFVGLVFAPKARRLLRVAAVIAALVAFAALAWTASRGALLGTGVGAVAMAICDRRLRAWISFKRIAVFSAVCGLLVAAAVAAMYATGRDRSVNAQSDATRLGLWKAAPAMMCDSPSGWGGFDNVGMAYSSWYAPADDHRFRLNLISDHLTMLVGHGRLGGFLYLFAWFAGLSLLAVFAWRGGSAIPLGVWMSLGTASAFNVVLFAHTVLWLPTVLLLVLVADRRWLRPRFPFAALVVGAAASFLALSACWVVGRRYAADTPVVCKDGNRVLVNGTTPDIWVVDDEEALGGVLAPRDIVAFYRRFPSAPAIGYVKDVDDVPSSGVRRLVLAGDSAQHFMVPYSRNPDSVRIPPEIVFLAPQFPPSAIPDELRARSRVHMVIGEFAARYWGDYAHPRDWVSVVPGAEVYIPGWMQFCLAGWQRASSVAERR